MEPVRTGLRNIMNELLRACPRDEAVIVSWPLVCGQEVAERARAIEFSNGKLTIEVPDADWRNQLQHFAGRYLSGYQGLLGPIVESVQFKVKPSISHQQSAEPKGV